MTGITLSSDQIRRAPPEVRRWIEHELATSLGLQIQASGSEGGPPAHLAGCSRDELAAVLTLIQGALPVVNVFFELGRKGTSYGEDRLQAYRLSDIQHHTQLQTLEQVIACLNLIDQSLHRIRGSADVSFYGLDGDYCFIATETQQNIRRLWFELIGGGEVATAPAGAQSEDGPGLRGAGPAEGLASAPGGAAMRPPQG